MPPCCDIPPPAALTGVKRLTWIKAPHSAAAENCRVCRRGFDMPGKNDLFALFLGPYGENNELLEKLLLEFLRDHV